MNKGEFNAIRQEFKEVRPNNMKYFNKNVVETIAAANEDGDFTKVKELPIYNECSPAYCELLEILNRHGLLGL